MTDADLLADAAVALVEVRAANKQLVALVENLQGDVFVYRDLMQASFDALRDVTLKLDRAREERDRLRDADRRRREEHFLRLVVDQDDDVCV